MPIAVGCAARSPLRPVSDIPDQPSASDIARRQLHPGQVVSASVMAPATNAGNVDVTLIIRLYGVGDAVQAMDGPTITLSPGAESALDWEIPDTGGLPIFAVVMVFSRLRRSLIGHQRYHSQWSYGNTPARWRRARSA